MRQQGQPFQFLRRRCMGFYVAQRRGGTTGTITRPRTSEMESKGIDSFLADCVRFCLRAEPLPSWPFGTQPACELAGRASFHGVALLLLELGQGIEQWPDEALIPIKQEARGQIFWEASHQQTIALLLEAFRAAGIDAITAKGTSLAYSLYAKPALRRRGDTDILILSSNRNKTRRVLKACGFEKADGTMPLQEDWQLRSNGRFDHVVDIHWRQSSSAAIASHLENDHPEARAISLPKLSKNARGLAPADNLVMTCINRVQHQMHGYMNDGEKLFEGDRLIWAVDIELAASSLDEKGWEDFIRSVAKRGCAPQVLSGLRFASRTIGTSIPSSAITALESDAGSPDLARYLTSGSTKERLKLDLKAMPGWSGKARILRSSLFPAEDLLRERYPGHANWPVSALRVRRIAGAIAQLTGLRS